MSAATTASTDQDFSLLSQHGDVPVKYLCDYDVENYDAMSESPPFDDGQDVGSSMPSHVLPADVEESGSIMDASDDAGPTD